MVQITPAGTWVIPFNGVNFQFSTAGTYDFRSATLTGTVTLTNTSGGAVTVKVYPGTLYVNAGPNITVEESIGIVINISGMVAGSRYRLYDTTNNVELANAVSATGTEALSFIYTAGYNYRLDVTRVNGASEAYYPFRTVGAVTAAGATIIVSQTANGIFTTIGIDPASVTEYSIIGTNLRIYIDDPDDTTVAQRGYVWYQNYLTTEAGIREQDGDHFEAISATRFVLENVAGVGMKYKNVSGFPLEMTGANISCSDGGKSTNLLDTTGDPIFINANVIEYGGVQTVTVEGDPAPTVEQIRTELDTNSSKLAAIVEDTGTTLPAQIGGITGGATAEEVRIEMDANSTKLADIEDQFNLLD
jgi:hypothetical protein